MPRDTSATISGVEPMRIRRAIYRQTKLVRSSDKRWSDSAEERFLEALAVTASVTAAARAAGFSTVAIYQRRTGEPGFAARWSAAMDVGYTLLEYLAMKTGTTTLEGKPLAGDHPMPRMTMAEEINLRRLHRAGVRDERPQRSDWRAQEPDIELVRAQALRRVAVVQANPDRL